MNLKKMPAALALAALLLFAPACAKQKAVPAGTSRPASSLAEASQPVSQGAASQPASSGGGGCCAGGASSGTASSAAQGGTVPQQGAVLPVKTDDETFDRKFAANSLDKAYRAEMEKAVSNVEMAKVSEKYAALWQKEIAAVWGKLERAMKTDSSKKPAALKAEQQKWEAGKSAALQKIAADAQTGGSMAQVDAASRTMEFYRARAARLSRELYDYTKSAG